MTDLVQIQNKQVVTSSLEVAKHFNKRHDNVMRDIEKLIGGLLKIEDTHPTKMFYLDNYTNEQNGQKYPHYLMNRDGFNLLVMGFTGEEALEWKMKFVKAFNKMEKALALPKLNPNPHYRTRMIKTAVKDIGDTAGTIAEVFGVKKPMAMASAMQMIGVAYGIDVSPLEKFLPAETNPCYRTPTDLANELGIKKDNGKPMPAEVNKMLADLGLQTRVNKTWTLTEKGKQYGEVKPFVNHGHSGYQIQWHEDVIKLLKGEIKE